MVSISSGGKGRVPSVPKQPVKCILLCSFVFLVLLNTFLWLSKEKEHEEMIASLKQLSGSGWKSIDFKKEELKDYNFTCKWTTFTSTSTKSADFCVHPFVDMISESINIIGRWKDCDILPKLWAEQQANQSKYDRDNSIYIEVGANIGSCVMEMLLSTNVKQIVAFEPHPANLFALKSTISRLDPKDQKRIVLYPIGLGDTTAVSTIHSEATNMGNSMLDTFVAGKVNQRIAKMTYDVHIERLDSILNFDEGNGMFHVPLMKLDAQGYECKILEGMGTGIAKQISTIKFEYERNLLQAQNCSNLIPRLRAFGFNIQWIRGNGARIPINHENYENHPKLGMAEMLAIPSS